MKIFNKKNEDKTDGNNIIIEMALKEALKELKEEKEMNKNLIGNIKILSSANKKLMNENKILTNNISKTSKIGKEILKELGV
jgi:ribosomal protein L3